MLPRHDRGVTAASLPLSPPRTLWTPAWRAVVFVLAASSIWCLLAEFYGLCSMRAFTLWIGIPATLALAGLAVWDAARAGDHRLARLVALGCAAGLLAAFAYDAFRLPFVFARPWGVDALLPSLPLYKVFPRFGAMILGQPVEQPAYSWSAQLIGWAYHFSNGITFGVMYVAAAGEPRRRHWLWAVLMAVGIEAGMLLSPYPRFFGIDPGAAFIAVTLAAHAIFGVVMGVTARRCGA
jgi:hypothetical protein